jgi:predicted transcriptional regulator
VAGSADRRLALLSIHPRFAEAILSGRKKVELRRVSWARPVTHVVIYATAPVSQVIGMFEVKRVVRDRPRRLWDRYGAVCDVEPRFFRDYYEGLDEGVAILIGHVTRFHDPIPLSTLEVSSPPQNFRYVDARLVEAV